MEVYNKLLNTLDHFNYDRTNGYPTLGFNTRASHIDERHYSILNLLIWKYDLENKKFAQKSQDYGFHSISKHNFKNFLHAIKPCFYEYVVDLFNTYIEICLSAKARQQPTLQIFLPMMLNSGSYHYVSLYVSPDLYSNRFPELLLVMIPLKAYQNEPLGFNVFVKNKKDAQLTNKIKANVNVTPILTKRQQIIFSLVSQGYSSKTIAEITQKSQDSVLKLFGRINTKLSEFFDIPFASVSDATHFYRKCFIE